MSARAPLDRLDPDRAVVLAVDFQERLARAMSPKILDRCVNSARLLMAAAQAFELPVVVSEQYPKGLGPTVPDLSSSIDEVSAVYRLDKVAFSVCDAEQFAPVWDELHEHGRDQWIVVGMECHVCVYQTVRDLLDRDAAVFVPQDGVLSRTKDNWKVGLRLMERLGATIGATEVAVFDVLRRAGTPQFKQLSPLVR